MDREKRQFAWWYYFWFLVALSVITLFVGTGEVDDYAFWALETAGLAGLWAYLRRRPIVSRHLWRLYFVSMCVEFLYNSTRFLSRDYALPIDDGTLQSILISAWFLSSLVFLPLFVALWRYSFRSHEIWGRIAGDT